MVLSRDLRLYYHFNFDINKGGVFNEIALIHSIKTYFLNQPMFKKNLRTFYWKVIIFCLITSTLYFDFLNRLSYFLWESNLFWNCICVWRKKTYFHQQQIYIKLGWYVVIWKNIYLTKVILQCNFHCTTSWMKKSFVKNKNLLKIEK